MKSFRIPGILVLAVIYSAGSLAHNGEKPLDKVSKNMQIIEKMQRQYGKTDSSEARLSELRDQIKLIRSDIIIVRNLLAKGRSHSSQGDDHPAYTAMIEDHAKYMERVLRLLAIEVRRQQQ